MGITRLGEAGYGVRPTGSFVGKTAQSITHPVGIITRLGEAGYGVRRCGSFNGKATENVTHPVGLLTRLGEAGYGVRRYGPSAFAGKAAGGPGVTDQLHNRYFLVDVGKLMTQ